MLLVRLVERHDRGPFRAAEHLDENPGMGLAGMSLAGMSLAGMSLARMRLCRRLFR